MPGPSKSAAYSPSSSIVGPPRLELGTVLQARVMSGDHEPARLVDILPTKVDGEYVAVVAYLEGGEQEQVPISMLRTLEDTEVCVVYNVNISENASGLESCPSEYSLLHV